MVVKTTRPAGEVGQAIRRAIASIDPNQPVFLSVSMSDLIADSVADRRFVLTLLAITAALALLLAVAGVYGVISYTIARRTQEIGIRIAVGAAPRDVFALIFSQGFRIVALGLALGLGAAWVALRALASVVSGINGIRRSRVDRGGDGRHHRRDRVLGSCGAGERHGPEGDAAGRIERSPMRLR
ncbi:MAG TPA: FtsX-like permease family protein [Bryobacteraceae bacterium]|nr:FtsX-like permease family protein [Bryobacteraceae bacterium]